MKMSNFTKIFDKTIEDDADYEYSDENSLSYLDPNNSESEDSNMLNILKLRYNDIKETSSLLKQREENLIQREIVAKKKSESNETMLTYLEDFVEREKLSIIQMKEKDHKILLLEDELKLKIVENKRISDNFAALRKMNLTQKEKNENLYLESNNYKIKMKKDISRFENIVNKLNIEISSLKNENDKANKQIKIFGKEKFIKKQEVQRDLLSCQVYDDDFNKKSENPYRMPDDHTGYLVIVSLLRANYDLNLSWRVAEDLVYADHPLVEIADDVRVIDGLGERHYCLNACSEMLPSLVNYIGAFPLFPKDICKQSELVMLKFIYRSLLIILPYRYQIGEEIDTDIGSTVNKLVKLLYFRPCDRVKTKKYNFIENFNKEVRLLTYLILLKIMKSDVDTSAVVKRLFDELKSCADMRSLFLLHQGPRCLVALLRPGTNNTTRCSLEAISFLSREPLSTPEYLKQISCIDLISQVIILIKDKDKRLILYILMILFKITKIKENQKLFYMVPLKSTLEEVISNDNEDKNETLDKLVRTILDQLAILPVPPH